jgi:hypothetical protein
MADLLAFVLMALFVLATLGLIEILLRLKNKDKQR